jgi:hypothetical protein
MLVLALVAFLFAPGLLARTGHNGGTEHSAGADLAIAVLAPTLDQTELEPGRRIVRVDWPGSAVVLAAPLPTVSPSSPPRPDLAVVAEAPVPDVGNAPRCHPLRAPPDALLT